MLDNVVTEAQELFSDTLDIEEIVTVVDERIHQK